MDARDEVWNGVHHVVPYARASRGALSHRLGARLHDRAEARGLVTLGEFNLGTEGDYRIPDMAWIATGLAADQPGLYVPTVDVVVEMVSPGDDTEEKIPWYLGRAVREVWKITPAAETVEVVGSGGPRPRSDVFDLSAADIRGLLGWA
ncbi:Uma2 family endonuclease [Kineococcus sp. R86509]|uniref:Uma2 family endonuclease n=1 Tax=Kineococcus sp. R86509 TaxID=3093851 RepID=UPI0036D2CED9